MSDEPELQLDAFITPGTLLRAAREAQELSEREVADRLNWMPGYTAIIERDDYQALLRPSFARGYVKAYGKLVGVDEKRLLEAFDSQRASAATQEQKRVHTRPLQLQQTGVGVVIGLVLMLLLVLAVWWWRGAETAPQTRQASEQQVPPTEQLAPGEQAYPATGEK